MPGFHIKNRHGIAGLLVLLGLACIMLAVSVLMVLSAPVLGFV